MKGSVNVYLLLLCKGYSFIKSRWVLVETDDKDAERDGKSSGYDYQVENSTFIGNGSLQSTPPAKPISKALPTHAKLTNQTMDLIWPDNSKLAAKIEDRPYCIFKGHLLVEKTSSVLVTGCPGQVREVQILSDVIGNLVFSVTKAGVVVPVETELYYHKYQFHDEVTEVNQKESFQETPNHLISRNVLPKKVVLNINVYLTPKFVDHHEGFMKKAELQAAEAFAKADLYFHHKSFNPKVELVHGNKFYSIQSNPDVDSKGLAQFSNLIRKPFSKDQQHTAHILLTHSEGRTTHGISNMQGKCSSQNYIRTGIVTWRKDSSYSAYILAHELGHMFGMYHGNMEQGAGQDHPACTDGTWDGHFLMNNKDIFSKSTSCSKHELIRHYEAVLSSAESVCLDKLAGEDYVDIFSLIPEFSLVMDAIKATIGAGSSIASIDNSYNVAFLLETENYSDKHLSVYDNPIESGVIAVPPSSIRPGTKESMSGHKSSNTATGCVGTVSWVIGNSGRKLVVMYSVPYSHDFHTNWLAVGIFRSGDNNANYYNMYNSKHEIKFSRKQFYDDSNPVVYSGDDDYIVEGTMGTVHKPSIKVKLYPKSKDHLANSLKGQEIEHNRRH